PGAGDGITKRERGRLERGLRLVVIVASRQDIDMKGEPRRRRERGEHMGDVLAGEGADGVADEAKLDPRERPPGDVHHTAGERLVERGVGVCEPRDAGPIAEGGGHGLAEGKGAVLCGVVIVDVQVAGAGEVEIEAGVEGERREQVVEETDPGRDAGAAGAVEHERQGDVGLAGGSRDGGGARGQGRHAKSSSRSVRTRAAPDAKRVSRAASGSSRGATTPRGTTAAPRAARMSSGVSPTIQARRTPSRRNASATGNGSGLIGPSARAT